MELLGRDQGVATQARVQKHRKRAGAEAAAEPPTAAEAGDAEMDAREAAGEPVVPDEPAEPGMQDEPGKMESDPATSEAGVSSSDPA